MRSLLIAAGVLGLVYFLVTPSVVQLPPPGDYGQAKPLSAPDLSGKTVSLEDYRDKVVLVQVWATWCPYCKREIPGLRKLYKEEGPNGFAILAPAIDNDPAKVGPYARAQGIEYPVLLTPGGTDGWRGGGVPFAVLVERGGKVVRLYTGEKDMDFLTADVRAALRR